MSDPTPRGAAGYDERYWREYRARARKRAAAQMLLPIAALAIFVAVLKIVEPMDYPAGDLRNSLEFRLLFYGTVIASLMAGVLGALRWLRAEGRERR